LEHFGISVLVTTYQAGRLVLLRVNRGVVNTHFRSFPKPMGLAVHGNRLAISTALEVWEYHNVPEVAAKLEPAGKNDACILPRTGHELYKTPARDPGHLVNQVWHGTPLASDCVGVADGIRHGGSAVRGGAHRSFHMARTDGSSPLSPEYGG
jgi:hypothetical protein